MLVKFVENVSHDYRICFDSSNLHMDQTPLSVRLVEKTLTEGIAILFFLKERIKRKRIKFYLTLQVRSTKTNGEQVEIAEPHFHGRCRVVLNNEDIEPALRESIMKMFNSFIEYQREGSTWVLYQVLGVAIHIVQYNPIKGSSY